MILLKCALKWANKSRVDGTHIKLASKAESSE